jgi:hypothetical protein
MERFERRLGITRPGPGDVRLALRLGVDRFGRFEKKSDIPGSSTGAVDTGVQGKK